MPRTIRVWYRGATSGPAPLAKVRPQNIEVFFNRAIKSGLLSMGICYAFRAVDSKTASPQDGRKPAKSPIQTVMRPRERSFPPCARGLFLQGRKNLFLILQNQFLILQNRVKSTLVLFDCILVVQDRLLVG